MLMTYWIGTRKQPYRPAVVSASKDAVHVRGLFPLRSGSMVEVSDLSAMEYLTNKTLRVERCVCGPDGLFHIDLKLASSTTD